MILADYTFFDAFWSMLVFFLWFLWLWLLFTIWGDIFRRDDISGGKKTLWFVFTILTPFLGAFVYLITQDDGMVKRRNERARRSRHEFDEYVVEAAGSGGGAASEIARGKELLDRGVITQAEFDVLKANALAS